jgi:protein-S-isoprenylcysteine O-methyltransferase Ste14
MLRLGPTVKAFIEKLAVLVVVAGLVALIATKSVVSTSPLVIAGQIAAIAVLMWSRASFAKGAFAAGARPRGSSLITTGPYRLVRHPIYSAAVLFFWATVSGHWTPLNAGIALAVTLTILVRIPLEERLLRAAFADYDDYARRTKRIVPFIW